MKFIKLVSIFLFLSSYLLAQNIESKPNIIIIYTDDMGVGDMGFLGGTLAATPNIDAMAQQGKIFKQYYSSAPVCSPSRVGVLTGMYPRRWNIHTFLSTKTFNQNCEQSNFLDIKAPSMARILKSAGYATGHFGKWHMGGGRDVKDAPHIKDYGFDIWASTFESPNPDPLLTSTNWIWAPTDSIKRWNRTAYFVDKTIDFLKNNKAGKPCFVNLWPDDVHTPWVPEDAEYDKKEYVTKKNLKLVLAEYDKQIGRLFAAIKEMGIANRTLIIFTSDNGPHPSFNQLRTNGLRGVKNSLYEGGIKMPFFICWPGKIKAGQMDSKSVINAVDILPTLCNIAGAKLPNNYSFDGQDFSSAIFGEQVFQRNKDLYWEYGRNEFYNYPDATNRSLQLAVRHQNYKLFTTSDGSKTELYDLTVDPKETINIADKNPQLVVKLKAELIAWFNKN